MAQKLITWLGSNWDSIIAFFAAMWGIIKGGALVFKKVRKWYLYISEFIESVRVSKADITDIKKNVMPNVGKPLDDKITRIAEMVEIIGGRQSAMLHEAVSPMYELDANGYLIDVNRAWCNLTGLDKDEALGEGWEKVIHNEDLYKLREWGESYVESGVSFSGEFRIVNYKTKEVFNVRSTSTKCFNKEHEVILILGALLKL